jgi:hypothetical protein
MSLQLDVSSVKEMLSSSNICMTRRTKLLLVDGTVETWPLSKKQHYNPLRVLHGSSSWWHGQNWAWVPSPVLGYNLFILFRIGSTAYTMSGSGLYSTSWVILIYKYSFDFSLWHLQQPHFRRGWIPQTIHFVNCNLGFVFCSFLNSNPLINIRNRSPGDSTGANVSQQRAAYNKCRKETAEHDTDRELRNPRPKYSVSPNLCCIRTH